MYVELNTTKTQRHKDTKTQRHKDTKFNRTKTKQNLKTCSIHLL
jgi:hypothetical protein